MKIQKMSGHRNNFQEVWNNMMKLLKAEKLAEAVVIARLLWLRRNNFIQGKGSSSPGSIIQNAREEVQVFN